MKLKKAFKLSIAVPLVASIALGGLLVSALSAEAAVTPTVSTVIQNQSNLNISTALIGTMVNAVATVASSTATTSPTGTVDFNLYSNKTCSGSASVQLNVPLVNGVAKSGTTTLAASGLSYSVHYDGLTDQYTTADSQCISLSADQFTPSLSTVLSTTSIMVGSSAFDTATIANASNTPTGTVTYTVYTNSSCTLNPLSAGSFSVSNSVLPNSNALQFNTAGTYYWQVVYSGDLNNAAATSSCASEVLTVNSVVTPPPPSGAGTISGIVFNDVNGNDVKDSSDPGLSGWTVWLHKAGTMNKWGKHDGYDDPVVATAVTDANGNYSFGSLGAGTYFVEEQEKSGWTQSSDDMKVVLADSNASGHINFANVEKGNGDSGHGDDQNEGHGGKGHRGDSGHGNHRGWGISWGNWGTNSDK